MGQMLGSRDLHNVFLGLLEMEIEVLYGFGIFLRYVCIISKIWVRLRLVLFLSRLSRFCRLNDHICRAWPHPYPKPLSPNFTPPCAQCHARGTVQQLLRLILEARKLEHGFRIGLVLGSLDFILRA